MPTLPRDEQIFWVFSDDGGGLKEKKNKCFYKNRLYKTSYIPISSPPSTFLPTTIVFTVLQKPSGNPKLEIERFDTISLLQECDAVSGQQVRDFFTRKFLLHKDNPNIEDCLDIIHESPKKKSKFHGEISQRISNVDRRK